MTHPALPDNIRGTYAGIGHPAIIEHLTKLGVTAIELMPVHQFVDDAVLQEKGLSNYWGYNSISYFAPHNRYAATGDRGQQVQEFKAMVRALHAAGIEVILDVVYNHTAEGNHLGPTLSMRGIDNAAYYKLDDDKRFYTDYTGTGNSLNVRNPHSLQLIMDSLRYWVLEMHVDVDELDPRLFAAVAEQTELHTFCTFTEDREVRAVAVVRGTQRVCRSRPCLHRWSSLTMGYPTLVEPTDLTLRACARPSSPFSHRPVAGSERNVRSE